MPHPHTQLLLARHAETAWCQVIRPWLEQSHAGLRRSHVVVPTRGQAQGLKQRCVVEGVALLGVEFLSPGLARQKWLPLVGGKPAIGRELLLFELRCLIARRLETAAADSPEFGLLRSLQSDAERALDDFDDLLKAGFAAEAFEIETLRSVFRELVVRVENLGYVIGTIQSEKAAMAPVKPGEPRIGGRLLVHGLGAEAWGEFFNVAAFVRRFDDITVILPEPEFFGRRTLDENWVEMWQTLLDASAFPIDAVDVPPSCEGVASWWTGENGPGSPDAGGKVRVVAGRIREDEMVLVANEVVRLLSSEQPEGPKNIAVVFPKADPSHAKFVSLLEERRVPFVNLLPGVGASSQETRLLRGLVEFYARGGRLDELLALWPLLRAGGYVTVGLGEARDVVERLFEERQVHAMAPYLETLAGKDRTEWKEVNRIAQWLLPAWPEKLSLGEALSRIEKLCEPLTLALPPNWIALQEFSRREEGAIPVTELCVLLLSFLPEKAPAAGLAAQAGFAPVTLTTRRRAEGLAWSHVIFVESNAGVWPMRGNASGWLTDEHRTRLNATSRFSLGLYTADDRAALEKRGYAALARDTRTELIFSAAHADETDPEANLSPNSWLERVLWQTTAKNCDLQDAFDETIPKECDPVPPSAETRAWLRIWNDRRDPLRGFDENFLSVDPARVSPEKLSARLIEDGIQDPVTLWFGAVLEVKRVDPGALLRAGKRVLGKQAHRVLSAALRGANREGTYFAKPEKGDVDRRLAEALAEVRALWPADRYWDSFHARLVRICAVLLENFYALSLPGTLATELWIPENLRLELANGCAVRVTGRMDLVCADREGWAGSAVDIIDFKTGRDELSARKMAEKGTALQLGIYLAAARGLGAAKGRVWMIKPEPGEIISLEMNELEAALAPLGQIAAHLRTGVYGALTRDRNRHAASCFDWPLACVPIAADVLEGKYAATFGATAVVKEEAADA